MLLNPWAQRELIFTLVKRDLKVRYKASALGFLWSFGRPLFLMLILWGVFSHIVRITTEIPYALHLLTGLMPWMYLQGALVEAQNSLLANANVVKKVNLPTAVFPVAAVLSHLVHLVLALCVLALFIAGYAFFQDPRLLPSWEVIFLPYLVIQQTLLLFGIGLLLSSLNVFYRDVGSISEILLSAWFYLTPVIYPIQMARGQLKGLVDSDFVYYLYLLNPMTPLIVAYRRVLYGNYLRSAPEVADGTLVAGLGFSLLSTLAILALGAVVFGRMSRRFADEL